MLCAFWLVAIHVAATSDTLELSPRAVLRDPFFSRLHSAQSEITLRPENWEGRSLNLADLLAEQAGIETRKYGGVGSFQTVSVRGASGSRLMVFLDGVPLNSAGGGPVDLGKLNLDALERIEIHKGLAPASEGGNSLGGVIHLFSKSHGTHADLNISGGSYGTQRHSISGGVDKNARTSAFGSVAFTRADNDFPYLDRNHTPYNSGDDSWVTRENSAYQALETHAQVRFGFGTDQSLHVKMADSRNGGGLPGREGQVTRTAGFSNLLTQYLIGWEQRTSGGSALRADLSWDEETPEFHWTEADGLGLTTGRDSMEIRNRNSRAQGLLRWETPLGASLESKWKLSAFASAGWEGLHPLGSHAASENPGWENVRQRISVAGDLSFLPDSLWNFTVGGSVEGIADRTQGGATYYGDTLSPQEKLGSHPAAHLGAWWLPLPKLSLFANAGWFYHPPGLIDLYGGRWGMVANPDLRAERGINIEAGLRQRWKSGYSELGLFRNRIKDAFFYVQSANLAKPFNLDATLAQGLEISLDQTVAFGVNLTYIGTLQQTKNLSTTYYRGNLLPNEPDYKQRFKTRLESPGHLEWEYAWDYRSPLFRDPGNLQRIPSQHLHNALLRWKPTPHYALALSLQNLTDTYYEDVYSAFPSPGRQFLVTLTARL